VVDPGRIDVVVDIGESLAAEESGGAAELVQPTIRRTKHTPTSLIVLEFRAVWCLVPGAGHGEPECFPRCVGAIDDFDDSPFEHHGDAIGQG
jgi:hypothetical protein